MQVFILQDYICPSFSFLINQIQVALPDEGNSSEEYHAVFENIHQQQLLYSPNVVVVICKRNFMFDS